jgi:FAD-dependent urate hydroxylase
VHLQADGAITIETAHKIILANGVAGNNGAYIPPALAEGLLARRYAHTANAIDFAELRGKRVAVVRGAASVDLFTRRPALASLPVGRVRGYPGAYDNFPELPDAVPWQQAMRFPRAGSTPPTDAIERVSQFPNFRLHLAAPWLSAREKAGRIAARAADGEFDFDFAIAGTGYFVDPGAGPELADFAHHILLWRDRYTPATDEDNEHLGAHPYLGNAHEYLEKRPGAAPYLRDINVQNPAGFVSF